MPAGPAPAPAAQRRDAPVAWARCLSPSCEGRRPRLGPGDEVKLIVSHVLMKGL